MLRSTTPPQALTLVQPTLNGDFSLASTCGNTLPGGASCTETITFTPATTGQLSGQVTVNGLTLTLSGNGVDFSTAFNPTSGNDIAGINTSASANLLPIAGFSAPVSLTCTTTAPASTCQLSTASLVPSSGASIGVQITTTSKYTVIGYGGMGIVPRQKHKRNRTGIVVMLLDLAAAGALLRHRQTRRQIQRALCLLLVSAAGCAMLNGCSGKQPTLNGAYTGPGTYAYTLTATDGFLVHSTTYSLTVTAK